MNPLHQPGTKGDTVTAYREHLRQYVDIVKPGLISYDHYQFSVAADLHGPSRLEQFDPATGRWSRASGKRADLPLPRGGGRLARVRR